MTTRVLSIIGTRPEAIKMAPVIKALAASPAIEAVVCATGQHRQMLDQVLEIFAIRPDHDLDVMQVGHTLNSLASRIFEKIDGLYTSVAPDVVLVHGDTTTAMAAALAAFHKGIAVGHVEAGLRTYDMERPFPEEMNRRAIDLVAKHLYAPTESSRRNLLQEHLVSDRILVTGNTVIDALLQTIERIHGDAALRARLDKSFEFIDRGRRLLLVTGHRRESFGGGFERICDALARLGERGDLEIVYPVHLNPNVDTVVRERLGGAKNIHLIAPVDYLSFMYLLDRAEAILTDSGGVQEEAAALGKRVVIMREVTERPEGVEAGLAELVGTDPDLICTAVERALAGAHAQAKLRQIGRTLYGDGQAAMRILADLAGEAPAFAKARAS